MLSPELRGDLFTTVHRTPQPDAASSGCTRRMLESWAKVSRSTSCSGGRWGLGAGSVLRGTWTWPASPRLHASAGGLAVICPRYPEPPAALHQQTLSPARSRPPQDVSLGVRSPSSLVMIRPAAEGVLALTRTADARRIDEASGVLLDEVPSVPGLWKRRSSARVVDAENSQERCPAPGACRESPQRAPAERARSSLRPRERQTIEHAASLRCVGSTSPRVTTTLPQTTQPWPTAPSRSWRFSRGAGRCASDTVQRQRHSSGRGRANTRQPRAGSWQNCQHDVQMQCKQSDQTDSCIRSRRGTRL